MLQQSGNRISQEFLIHARGGFATKSQGGVAELPDERSELAKRVVRCWYRGVSIFGYSGTPGLYMLESPTPSAYLTLVALEPTPPSHGMVEPKKDEQPV